MIANLAMNAANVFFLPGTIFFLNSLPFFCLILEAQVQSYIYTYICIYNKPSLIGSFVLDLKGVVDCLS